MSVPDVRKKAARDTVRVTMTYDRDVIEWFRKLGRGYQIQINEVLRWYISEVEKQDEPKKKPRNQ